VRGEIIQAHRAGEAIEEQGVGLADDPFGVDADFGKFVEFFRAVDSRFFGQVFHQTSAMAGILEP